MDKGQGARLVIACIVKQRGVHSYHLEEVSAVHNVLVFDRIDPPIAKLFESSVELLAAAAGVFPIPPNLAPEHLADEVVHRLLEERTVCGKVVVVGQCKRVRGSGELIAIAVVAFLVGLLGSHPMPVAVELSGHPADVAQVRPLHVVHLRIVFRSNG